MQIINIFVAIIVALGFWNKSNKERDLATEKATLTKTVILLVLTAAITFFYYKTYQVATFNNEIIVKGVKGSYSTYTQNYEGGSIDNIMSRDKIASFVLINRFSNRRFDFSDPFYDLYKYREKSGFKVDLKLDGSCNSTRKYPSLFSTTDTTLIEHYSFCYDIYFLNNKIPSLFPLFIYDNWTYSGEGQILVDTSVIYDNKRFGNNTKWHLDDFEIRYLSRLATYERQKSISQSTFNEHINSLNFFSAADLSQCIYQFNISSDIPIDSFLVCFDIPIEVTSYYDKMERFDSRCFSVDVQENNDGTVKQFLNYHIKLPTLANLQLIRSLILTTLLTALYSLFFSSLYYYCRKKYIEYLQKKPVSYKKRKKILLVWMPTGKIVVWSIILLSAITLILSILNRPIILDAIYFDDRIMGKLIIIFILIVILSFCYVVYTFFLIRHEDSLKLGKKKKRTMMGSWFRKKRGIGLPKILMRKQKKIYKKRNNKFYKKRIH